MTNSRGSFVVGACGDAVRAHQQCRLPIICPASSKSGRLHIVPLSECRIILPLPDLCTMPTEDEWLRDIREAMGRRFAAESQALLDDPSMDRPLREQKKDIRKKLRDHGTDVDLNDRDVTGDGDQSPIMLDYNGKQVYRDIYAVGTCFVRIYYALWTCSHQ